MGKQDGIIPIKATIDNLTFYKSKDGYMIRKKGGVDAQRMATDPNYARARENAQEFARAGKACKALRDSVYVLLKRIADKRVTGRLTRAMKEVLKADKTSSRGLRNVIDGEVALLEGFEFNKGSYLGTSLFAPYSATIDRATGDLTIKIQSFVPDDLIAAPQGATHYRIISAGTEIDFEKGTNVTSIKVTAELAWDKNPTADITLVNQVPAHSTHPLLLMLGIEYGQEVNGKWYALNDSSFNAMAIVKVDTGV
jgi:hypothetical protein